jgi:hypothetical protein
MGTIPGHGANSELASGLSAAIDIDTNINDPIMKATNKTSKNNQNKLPKEPKLGREGIVSAQVFNTFLRVVVPIENERDTRNSGRELLIRRPWNPNPEWVPGHDVIEITRLSRPKPTPPKPLTAEELAEYRLLLHRWISTGGSGEEFLKPDEISRFSLLSERASRTRQF